MKDISETGPARRSIPSSCLNRRALLALPLIAPIVLSACSEPASMAQKAPADSQIDALKRAILALSETVNPAEAERAATLAITYPKVLAKSYGVSDPPLVHNMKVNAGLRPRGLCWHWAEDMEKRLAQENFRTLTLHRAIANSEKAFRIAHSTVIISGKSLRWDQGLVLDPWRFGGALYWGKPEDDHRYSWRPRAEVLAKRRP